MSGKEITAANYFFTYRDNDPSRGLTLESRCETLARSLFAADQKLAVETILVCAEKLELARMSDDQGAKMMLSLLQRWCRGEVLSEEEKKTAEYECNRDWNDAFDYECRGGSSVYQLLPDVAQYLFSGALNSKEDSVAQAILSLLWFTMDRLGGGWGPMRHTPKDLRLFGMMHEACEEIALRKVGK